MSRVLLTAFEPYDQWTTNASWLTLVELTREMPEEPTIITRRYPVDFQKMRERLEHDLTDQIDHVIMLGQAPGRSQIDLETIGLNRAVSRSGAPAEPLVIDGPLAYATNLPADAICREIRSAGIPCQVSYHAGTYLCNAALYLSLHLIHQRKLATSALFVHLPIAPTQAAQQPRPEPSMATTTSALAIRILLGQLGQMGHWALG